MERDDEARVRGVEERLVEAIGAADPEAIVDCYAPDAVLMFPGRPPLAGREAIAEHFRRLFVGWRLELASTTEGVLVEGDLATLRGTVVQRVERRRWPRLGVTVRLRHLLVLRRDGAGEWRVLWDTVQKAERAAPEAGDGGLLTRVLGR